uniref:Uncharacterized protein n=1 Tax=Arundo donax TaxID=35708 RepID=A0A0A9AI36_ARUDO
MLNKSLQLHHPCQERSQVLIFRQWTHGKFRVEYYDYHI